MTYIPIFELLCDSIEITIKEILEDSPFSLFTEEITELYERGGMNIDHDKSAIIYTGGFCKAFRILSQLDEDDDDDFEDIMRVHDYALHLTKLVYKSNGVYLSRLKHQNENVLPFNDWAMSIINNEHFDMHKFIQNNPSIHKIINILPEHTKDYKKELIKYVQQTKLSDISGSHFYKHDYDHYKTLIADSEIDDFIETLNNILKQD